METVFASEGLVVETGRLQTFRYVAYATGEVLAKSVSSTSPERSTA